MQSLNGGKPRISLALGLSWLYKRHVDVFAGIQKYAQAAGWQTLVDEFPAESLPHAPGKELPVNGIIARASRKLARRSQALDLPVVNVWLSSPVRNRLPGVFPDFAAAGRLRAEHLLSRGLRNFASLSFTDDLASQFEVEAFQQEIASSGANCEHAEVLSGYSNAYNMQQDAEHVMDAWMDGWELPVGVFVYDDVLGRQVAQMCHRRGWRIPEDVAIVSGANEEVVCQRPRPSLSSIERGYEKVGYEAARLLDELIQSSDAGSKNSSDPPRHILIPPQELVIRESTDFFAVSDELVSQALSYISGNSHRGINQDDVSAAVATGTRTLQRRFRQALDRSIADMICHVRIERAKRDLTQSQRSIQEIARDTGFGDPMRMYRTFRRELGITPTDYRKQSQTRNG